MRIVLFEPIQTFSFFSQNCHQWYHCEWNFFRHKLQTKVRCSKFTNNVPSNLSIEIQEHYFIVLFHWFKLRKISNHRVKIYKYQPKAALLLVIFNFKNNSYSKMAPSLRRSRRAVRSTTKTSSTKHTSVSFNYMKKSPPDYYAQNNCKNASVVKLFVQYYSLWVPSHWDIPRNSITIHVCLKVGLSFCRSFKQFIFEFFWEREENAAE